jgi:hypothetical protein
LQTDNNELKQKYDMALQPKKEDSDKLLQLQADYNGLREKYELLQKDFDNSLRLRCALQQDVKDCKAQMHDRGERAKEFKSVFLYYELRVKGDLEKLEKRLNSDI